MTNTNATMTRPAVDAAMSDREFLDEARRSGLEIDAPISGREVEDILTRIYATPKDLIARFEAIRNGK